MKLREYLMRGFEPCLSHDCIVKKPDNIGTNSGCKCLLEMSRNKLSILSSRLQLIIDHEIEGKGV